MGTLLTLYRATGKDKFLEPLPRAIEYFRRSRLPDGRLARFYELKTNKPLYFTREDYQLTYSDADMPTHYGFKSGYGIEGIAREYDRLRDSRGEGVPPLNPRNEGVSPSNRPSPALTERVKSVMNRLDDRGRWVEDGRLRDSDEAETVSRVITTRTFINNIRTLSTYVANSH
jgi:hypothetical protein